MLVIYPLFLKEGRGDFKFPKPMMPLAPMKKTAGGRRRWPLRE
jgi:hypothetical protein